MVAEDHKVGPHSIQPPQHDTCHITVSILFCTTVQLVEETQRILQPKTKGENVVVGGNLILGPFHQSDVNNLPLAVLAVALGWCSP